MDIPNYDRGGIAHLPDILKRIGNTGGWIPCDFESKIYHDKDSPSQQHKQKIYEKIWHDSMGDLVEPASALIEAMNDGLEHAGLQLEIIPRPGTKNYFDWMPGAQRTKQTDLEAERTTSKPGSQDFSRVLEAQLIEFEARRLESLAAWANSKDTSASTPNLHSLGQFNRDEDPVDGKIPRDRQQLYLILYMQHMVSMMSDSSLVFEIYLTC